MRGLVPDGIPEELAGNADSGPQHADDKAELVVELEHPIVDVDLVKLHVVDEIRQEVRHGGGGGAVLLVESK